MNSDFVKIATFAPQIKVCDVAYNVESIKNGIDLGVEQGAHILVLPELCLTGATAGDLFYSDSLLNCAKKGLLEICE